MTTQAPPTGGEQRHGYPPLSALRRSRSDRKVLGVAGGLGRYAGIDPLVFRILFVVLTVFGGSGLLLYALGWLLVPDDGETESEGQRLFRGSRVSISAVVALVVVLLVGLAVTGSLIDSGPGRGGVGVLIVVAVVAVLLLRNGPSQPAGAAQPGEPATPLPAAEPGAYGQTSGTAYSAPGSGYPATAPLPTPPGPPSYAGYPTYGPPPPPTRPQERSVLGRATLSVALIVVGALVGWNAATGSDVPAQAVVASALAVVGLGLVVGAFAGRARGLVAWGLLLTLLASATAFSGVSVRGGVGDRTWRPASISEVRSEYRLAAGQSELDLSAVDFSTAGRTRVQLRQGVGDVLVELPADVVVLVDADVRVGELRLPGRPTVNGSDLTDRVTVPAGSSPSAAVLVVDAHLGAGSLEVRRAAS